MCIALTKYMRDPNQIGQCFCITRWIWAGSGSNINSTNTFHSQKIKHNDVDHCVFLSTPGFAKEFAIALA